MDVVSICPLPVASVLWQPRAGSFSLTVVCKATFLLAPTTAQLAPEQEDPNEEDNHWNDDAARSLYSASDLSPLKTRADVVLVGHAFAPGRAKVRSLVTRLQVGTIDKSIEVSCDRAYRQDGTIDEGPPFARMPLVYERAAGGAETSNPVGLRVDTVDAYGRVTIPNLQPAGRRITSRADFSEPIAFGPIAPAWPARRDRLGRHAGSFALHNLRTQPLPEDLDPLYFNIAPLDQQIDELRDRERIVLENLHPEHARLSTQLPGIRPTAVVERAGRAPYALVLRCDTLWIDTDRSRCTLVFRGQVPLEQPKEPGRIVVSMEEGASPDLEWSSDRRPASEAQPRASAKDPDTLIPAEPPEVDLRGTGEFVQQPRASAVLPFAQQAAPPPRDDRPSRVSGGLPFAPSPAPAPAPAPAASPGRPADLPPGWATSSAVRPAPSMGIRPSEPSAASYPTPPPVAPAPPPATSSLGKPSLGGPVLGAPLGAPPPPTASSAIMPPPAVVPSALQAPALVPSSPAAAPVDNSPWASAARGAPVQGAPATVGSVAALGAAAAAAGPTGGGSVLAPSVERSTLGTSAAASGTALSASNVAAASSGGVRGVRQEAGPARATPAWDAVRAPSVSRGTTEGRDVVELLWFDPESVPRIRKKPAWRKIVEELEKKPPDTELDDAAQAKEPMEIEDRREVFEILIRADVTDPEGVNDAMNSGIRDDGKFVPPLVMVAGEVFFPFDELATLKVTVTTVTPLVGQDENLRSTVDVAKDFLKMPDLATAPAVSEGLTTRIKDAFGQGKRMVAPGYLDQQTERALLEGRHYQRREVFGGKHVRALLLVGATQTGIPTYIRDEISKKLPMYQKFKARMICEVHMPADQYESHPNALRVMALGRVSSNPKGV